MKRLLTVITLIALPLLLVGCASEATSTQATAPDTFLTPAVTPSPSPSPTPKPKPTPTLTPKPAPPVQQPVQQTPPPAQQAPPPPVSSGGDKNCSDFATHAEAQSYFESHGGSPSNNVDGLDADHDGIACESLK